jgi:hypothetical protein
LSESDKHWHHVPKFGGDHGIIYPAIAHVLWYATYLSPVKAFNLSATGADLWLICCWIVETIIAVVLSTVDEAPLPAKVFMYFFVTYRLFDLLLILAAFLILGFYREKTRWPFRRGLTLVLCNTFEIFFLYGTLFFLLSRDCPVAAEMHPPFCHVLEGVYFSIVTASTLGYGDFHPKGWLVRFLATSQSVFVLLVLIIVIGSFKGASFRVRDVDES